MPRLHRQAEPADLPRIVDIYNATIPSRRVTADLEPVSVASRVPWFEAHRPDAHPLWVVEADGDIAAWLSFSAFHARPAYARSTELSIYVDRRFRRQGLGGYLLAEALAAAPELGFESLLGLVFGHNRESLALFERFGFVRWGELPGVAELDGIRRDLVIVGRRVDESASAGRCARNRSGQALDFALPGWQAPPPPPRAAIEGRLCRLEPLDPERHAAALYAADGGEAGSGSWTYLPYGPFEDFAAYLAWVEQCRRSSDPLFYAIVAQGQALGVASYLRIDRGNGSIEVGHLHFSPRLARTAAATEAMFLMMKTAFELGYRRYEWKCHALNAPSRAAAQRLGLSFEGIFRQAAVVKGRNRDTAWYAAIDSEWPALRAAFQSWLEPSNFDPQGRQKTPLSGLTAPILKRCG